MPIIQLSIPAEFFCPITQEIMHDAAKTADGHVYDREAILEWFKKNDTSPLTGLKLESKKLTDAIDIKKQIKSFYDKHELCLPRAFSNLISEIASKKLPIHKLQKLNYLAEDFHRTQAIHIAVLFRHVELTSWLLSEGASPHIKSSSTGETPLHSIRCPLIAEMLIAEGADVKAIDKYGNTPLHSAAARGFAKIVKVLLDAGADAKAKNSKNETAHDILEYVASGDFVIPEDYDRTGYLLELAQSNIQDDYTAQLYLAIKYHQISEVKGCLHMKSEGDHVDLDGEDAIQTRIPEIVNLVCTDININKANRYQETPLHIAATYKRGEEIVKLLLNRGANLNALNRHKSTPMEVAKQCKNNLVVAFFNSVMLPQEVSQLKAVVRQQDEQIQQMQIQIQKLTEQVSLLMNKQPPQLNFKHTQQANFFPKKMGK